MPIHWRRPSSKPNSRSPSTASTTKPPEITACASDSGAKPSAPTWNAQPRTATAQPIVHHFDRNSSVALLTGRRMSTAGAATAPRCFHRNARFVASAVPHANANPIQSLPSTRTPPKADRPLHAAPTEPGVAEYAATQTRPLTVSHYPRPTRAYARPFAKALATPVAARLQPHENAT